ncbi:MerR family transcriptional regulator [Achromobacter sp. GG226]|uniref:chaperone modulator CbpM n=1 Tax=Verticiella alkaliphila TaxID=2779529 RepID=UPI001C0DFA04|nr:chaperone modulator CbpM [Verticiella sp. GG226]MBU4612580.1 MerR family transcriptional regulator [Verticiella sp. GG226]
MREHDSVSIVGETEWVSLADACRVCRVREAWVLEFVAEGVAEPRAPADSRHWQFDAAALRRLRVAARLRRDLGVNPAGAALALELMDELERMGWRR